MSSVGVMEIIGSLQLVSCGALVAYALAAWRRKDFPEVRPHPHSVQETLKLLSNLQRLSSPPPRWRLRSPLKKAEEELWQQAELLRLLRRGSSPDRSSAPSVTEGDKVSRH